MMFGVLASPEKIEMMVRVLDTYCIRAGIVHRADREDVAATIFGHYANGIETEDDLMFALLNKVPRRTAWISN
jgi:hypothetical protein